MILNPAFVLWWLVLIGELLLAVLSILINWHLFRVMRNRGEMDGSLIGDAL
jgi:hypothetical protein